MTISSYSIVEADANDLTTVVQALVTSGRVPLGEPRESHVAGSSVTTFLQATTDDVLDPIAVTDYRLVTAPSIALLASRVTTLIAAGWQPTGGIKVTSRDSQGSYAVHQAMIKGSLGKIADLRTKYLYAVTSRVHMFLDADLLGITALSGAQTQAAANARANLLQTYGAAHSAGVGTFVVDGEHLKADTVAAGTLAAVPIASSLATSITLQAALIAWLNAHSVESGVHFHDDTTGQNATVTNAVATTLAHVYTNLNDILAACQAHNGLASY